MKDEGRQDRLRELARTRFQESIDLPLLFFEREAEQISAACLAMARRFHAGGRLVALGAGSAMTDARHVAVEFVHPVIVGKRALPAIALSADFADRQAAFARQIVLNTGPADMVMGIDPFGEDPGVLAGLAEAAGQNSLTIGLTGGRGGGLAAAGLDFCFVVPTSEATVIQEIHETLYHILWELVHVFFEHRGLLEEETPSGSAG